MHLKKTCVDIYACIVDDTLHDTCSSMSNLLHHMMHALHELCSDNACMMIQLPFNYIFIPHMCTRAMRVLCHAVCSARVFVDVGNISTARTCIFAEIVISHVFVDVGMNHKGACMRAHDHAYIIVLKHNLHAFIVNCIQSWSCAYLPHSKVFVDVGHVTIKFTISVSAF